MDTLKRVQHGHAPCLLTLTGRKTQAEIIRCLPDGTAASVIATPDKLEAELEGDFPRLFSSITVDNRVEFSDYEGLKRSCFFEGKRFQVYFVLPTVRVSVEAMGTGMG
jgi:IS30 family transposase